MYTVTAGASRETGIQLIMQTLEAELDSSMILLQKAYRMVRQESVKFNKGKQIQSTVRKFPQSQNIKQGPK